MYDIGYKELRKDLKCRANKNACDFHLFDAIRSSGDNINTSKISIDEAEQIKPIYYKIFWILMIDLGQKQRKVKIKETPMNVHALFMRVEN